MHSDAVGGADGAEASGALSMSLAGGGLTGGEHSGDAAYMHSQAEVENSMAILGKKKSQHTEREKSQYTEEKS